MHVSRSAYYDWLSRPAQVIIADELHFYRRTKHSDQIADNIVDQDFNPEKANQSLGR